jgi:hypothetical protein
MAKKKELEWGETPWDDLTREELLKEVWKMFSALQSADTVLNQIVNNRFFQQAFVEGDDYLTTKAKIETLATADPYWGKGTGARAVEKVNQAIAEANTFDNLYGSFFRYADDLLFKRKAQLIGDGWAVCPKCGTMLGETSSGESSVGKTCEFGGDSACGGIYRPLEWSDLRPNQKLIAK